MAPLSQVGGRETWRRSGSLSCSADVQEDPPQSTVLWVTLLSPWACWLCLDVLCHQSEPAVLLVSWRSFQKHIFPFCLNDHVPETSEDNAQAFPICNFSWGVWGPVATEMCGVSRTTQRPPKSRPLEQQRSETG